MQRYFLQISYKGTNYHGWQKQPNANTVQAELDRAIELITSTKNIETVGCGRTDTGVHASSFYVHVDLEKSIEDLSLLKHKLNRILPQDISVLTILSVKPDAHARFDATSRQYNYFVHHQKNSFLNEISVHLHKVPDYTKMNLACIELMKYSDFASFCKVNSDNKTTICKVSEAEWKQIGDQWVFNIRADRFLRNMVRAVVGTLLEVGYGTISIDEFKKIIESGNRSNAGESVAAHGLFLTEVTYPYIQHG